MVHWDQQTPSPGGGRPHADPLVLSLRAFGRAAGEGGAFPVLWYNLGGVIVNALTALVFLPLTLIPNGRQSSKYHSTKPPGPTPTPERSPEPGSA